MVEGLDRNVVALMKAIAQQETPGGKAVAGASGELPSRFQYTTGTWKGAAANYLRDPNAELTPENENKVTYQRIKDWKDKGFKPHQIASMWNAGEGKPEAWKDNKGVNSFGVSYDTPTYVKKVIANFNNNIAAEKSKTTLGKPIPAEAPQEETPNNLLTLGYKGIKKGLEVYDKAAEFTGIPWALRKGGEAIGAGIDKTLDTVIGNDVRAIISENRNSPLVQKAAETAKIVRPELPTTGEFLGTSLAEGAKAAPLALLGRVPSAAMAIPSIVEGVKEKDPTKLAIGALGTFGAFKTKGNWIDKSLLASGIKTSAKAGEKVLPKEAKLAEQATGEFRTILRPTAGEIKNIEIRQGKNIDDYYRLAAEERLPIKETPDKKLDTTEAVAILKPKQTELHNIINAQLETNPAKQFDLLEVGSKAKEELSKTIKNATDFKSATKDIDEYIADAIERDGRFVSGKQLNDFKSGMWSAGYNMLKPTAQSSARKLGHLAKEMIEEAYPDLTIKQLNELSGRYATLGHLLENANGRVIQGGAVGRYTAQILGGIAGAHVPVLGPIAGQFAGGKVSDVIYSPTRRALAASKKAEKAGIIEKSFKEAKQEGVRSLVERQPKYPLLEAPTRSPQNTGAGVFRNGNFEPAKQLPAPAIRPPVKDTSGVFTVPAKKGLPTRNPKTGRMQTTYTTDGISRPPKINQAYGAFAGAEPYQDENGNWKIRFNPEKALLGLGLTVGGKKVTEFFKSSPKAIALLEDLKNGSISEAKFKVESEKLLKKEGLLDKAAVPETAPKTWSELQKTNPELWNTGILRKSQAPYKAVGEIPPDVHSAQGKWQNYGQNNEIPADVIYKRIESGSFKGEYEDFAGNPVRDSKTGNILRDTYDETTGEWIKPTVSNEQLKNNLLEKFSTKNGKEYLNKVIEALPKNTDGSITAYRIGSIGKDGVQSYTLSEGMAKTFSNQGTDIPFPGTPGLPKGGYKDFGVLPTNMVKIDPKGIKAWSPYDAEILVESKFVKSKSQLEQIWKEANKKGLDNRGSAPVKDIIAAGLASTGVPFALGLGKYLEDKRRKENEVPKVSRPYIPPKKQTEEKPIPAVQEPKTEEKPKDKNQEIEEYVKKINVKIDSTGQLRKWGNTLAIENNNPGNLKFAGQPGAKNGRAGFAKFPTPERGFRALVKQIQSDQSKAKTLEDFIHKYSPPTENDTKKYLSFLKDELGVNSSTKISELDPIEIAKAVARFESQTLVKD